MSSIRKIFITPDGVIRKRLFDPDAFSTTDRPIFKRGDYVLLLVGFLDDDGNLSEFGPGASSPEAESCVVKVGMKPLDEFDADTFIAYGEVEGINADGFYEIELPLNTEAINDLLAVNDDESDDIENAVVMFEVTWSIDPSADPARWSTTSRVNALIENDVIRGGETPPSAEAGSVDEYIGGDEVDITESSHGKCIVFDLSTGIAPGVNSATVNFPHQPAKAIRFTLVFKSTKDKGMLITMAGPSDYIVDGVGGDSPFLTAGVPGYGFPPLLVPIVSGNTDPIMLMFQCEQVGGFWRVDKLPNSIEP